ncbi:MAG: type transport system permease protein [Halanaerobiales bacterium]|nr:type transport system permease protein [Halanaerobiales bacterium]
MHKLARIRSIIIKDLKESLKNKTILIVVILPLAASLLFSLIDNSQLDKTFNIGIIEGETGNLAEFISGTAGNLQIFKYSDINQGKKAMENGLIDGLIVKKGNGKNMFLLYLDRQNPVNSLVLKDTLQNLIRVYLKIEPAFNLQVVLVENSRVEFSFLPVWITVTMTMIGVLVISGNLAEEKDNRTLDALLVSPASMVEVLIGKGIFGIIFTVLTVLIMGLLKGVLEIGPSGVLSLLLIVITGSLGFTALGLLIGVITESQSSARSIGTVIYFPFLFPVLIKDLSAFTRQLAQLFPTYYLQQGLERVLIYQGGFKDIWFNLVILLIFSMIILGFALIKIKKAMNT